MGKKKPCKELAGVFKASFSRRHEIEMEVFYVKFRK